MTKEKPRSSVRVVSSTDVVAPAAPVSPHIPFRFSSHDPYLSFFSEEAMAFRDSNGALLPPGRYTEDLLRLARDVAIAILFAGDNFSSREEWESLVDGRRSTVRTFRDLLTKLATDPSVDRPKVLRHANWYEATSFDVMAQTFDVASYLAAIGKLGGQHNESAVDIQGSFCWQFYFSSLEEIDGALAAIAKNNAIGSGVDHGIRAARAFSSAVAIQEGRGIAGSSNVWHTMKTEDLEEFSGASGIATTIRDALSQFGKAGGTKSGEVRRKTAIDEAEVEKEARGLGWPQKTRGINKKLALKFGCTPEWIGRILKRRRASH